MLKRLTLGAMLTAASATAHAGFINVDADQSVKPVIGSVAAQTVAVVSSNNFKSQLAGQGVTTYTHGTSLGVDASGYIDFFYYGKEAGYRNVFTANGIGGTSATYDTGYTPTFQDYFAKPIAFGSIAVNSGTLDLGFCTFMYGNVPGGCLGNAVNDSRNILSSQSMVFSVVGDTAWIFWDDSGAGPDDNHDDAVIKAVFRKAEVPEPATLALFGAALLGLGISRRRRA